MKNNVYIAYCIILLFPLCSFSQEINAKNLSCKSFLEEAYDKRPILDLSSVVVNSRSFKVLFRTLISRDTSERSQIEALAQLTDYNFLAVGIDHLNRLLESESFLDSSSLSVDQVIAKALSVFYVRYSKDGAKLGISILESVSIDQRTNKLNWYRAQMYFINGDVLKAQEILLNIFNSVILSETPSQTLIYVLVQISEVANVKLENEVLVYIREIQNKDYRVFVNPLKNWGPYIEQIREREAFKIRSFYDE